MGSEEAFTQDDVVAGSVVVEELDLLDEFVASDEEEVSLGTAYVLRCFGNTRRGANVNERIRNWFDQNGIEMVPAIEDADYYGKVTIRKAPVQVPEESNLVTQAASNAVGANGWTLSMLKDDAEELDSLAFGDTVEVAVNLMHKRNRSKLPLFFSKNDYSSLVGTVTLAALTFDQTSEKTKLLERALTQVPVVGTEEKLLDWIPTILRHGFIYGKNSEGEIVQIYTTHDVAIHMNAIAAMFLRANEVEELIRGVLGQVPATELLEAKRNVSQLSDISLDSTGKRLTRELIGLSGNKDAEDNPVDRFVFADYMKCVGDEQIWNKYFGSLKEKGITKEQCVLSLNEARIARNSVMHFNRRDTLEHLTPSFEVSATWLRTIDLEPRIND